MRLFCIVSVMLVIAALCTGTVAAQSRTRGTLSGIVEDSTGNRVPNANVTLTGGYGTETTTSNDNGEFQFSNLIPAYYDIKAELTGFRPGTMRNMEVRVGEVSTLRVVLQPGEVTSVIDISSG